MGPKQLTWAQAIVSEVPGHQSPPTSRSSQSPPRRGLIAFELPLRRVSQLSEGHPTGEEPASVPSHTPLHTSEPPKSLPEPLPTAQSSEPSVTPPAIPSSSIHADPIAEANPNPRPQTHPQLFQIGTIHARVLRNQAKFREIVGDKGYWIRLARQKCGDWESELAARKKEYNNLRRGYQELLEALAAHGTTHAQKVPRVEGQWHYVPHFGQPEAPQMGLPQTDRLVELQRECIRLEDCIRAHQQKIDQWLRELGEELISDTSYWFLS